MSTATWPTCPVHGRMEECTIADTQPAFRCLVSTAPSIFERPTQDDTQSKMARVPASQIFRLLAEIGQNAACPCAHWATSHKRKIRYMPPLFKRGASSCPSQGGRHRGNHGAPLRDRVHLSTYLPTCSGTGQNGPKCARKGVPSTKQQKPEANHALQRKPQALRPWRKLHHPHQKPQPKPKLYRLVSYTKRLCGSGKKWTGTGMKR